MTSIKDLLINQDFNYQDPFAEAKFKEDTAKVINKLFEIMAANKTAFAYAYPNQESIEMAKKIWREAFFDAKLCDLNLIEKGIIKMFRDPNPFAITVGAFINLCNPSFEELGWPSIEDAYKEAIALSHPQMVKNWTHAAIKETVMRIGSFNLSHMPENVSRKKFEEVYKIMMSEQIAGKEPPKLNKPQEHEQFRRKSQEERNWETFRKGEGHVNPPPGGWVNTDSQDKQHKDRLLDYREAFEKRGVTIPDYSHLNSRDKAMPVILELLKKMETKQAKAKKTMKG